MKVLVELTLGHRATIRERPTSEGFTHDWEVFVRVDSGNIQAFVDRVIFHLHESFPKPRRVVKEPPYCVKESGYAGFIFHIEILFRNKGEPKKAVFQYDLFLQSTGAPINPSRKEKLIFNYPNEEFAKKLFKAGGVALEEPGHSSGDKIYQAIPEDSSKSHHSGGGKSSKAANSSKTSPKNSFETLFGTPIKRSSKTNATGTSSSSSAQGSAIITKEKPEKPSKEKIEKVEKSSKSLSKSSKFPSTPETSSPKNSKSSSKSSSSDKGPSKKNLPLPPEKNSPPKKAKKSFKEVFEATHLKSHKSSNADRQSSSVKKSHSKKKESSLGVSERDRHSSKIEKQRPVSPISSSSSSSRCSSESSLASAVSSEEDSDSESEAVPTPSPPVSKKSPPRKRPKISSPVSVSASISSPPSSASSTSSVPVSSTTNKKRKGGETPVNKKLIIEKSIAVSSIKDHRESKKSKTKSSTGAGKEKSKSKQVVSCEDVSSAISPNISSPGPPPKIKTSKSKRHEVSYVEEADSPPPISKSKSSKNSERGHSSASSSHSKSKSSKSSKSAKHGRESKDRDQIYDQERKQKEPREKSHDRDRRRDSRDHSSRTQSRSRSESVSSSTSSSDGTTNSTNALNMSDIGNDDSSPGSSGGSDNSSGDGGGGGFSHASVAGSITAEMKLLKDLHAKISSLEDPDKLQEVVDIVEACGKDAWTVENGVTFDFDLCKLNAKTIGKLIKI